MIHLIFLTIIILYAIPGHVKGLQDFKCDQPFGTKAERGFSVIRSVTYASLMTMAYSFFYY